MRQERRQIKKDRQKKHTIDESWKTVGISRPRLYKYVAAAARTFYVKLMTTDLICVKRSRPYGPFSRPQPLCLKPPHGEALSNAL